MLNPKGSFFSSYLITNMLAGEVTSFIVVLVRVYKKPCVSLNKFWICFLKRGILMKKKAYLLSIHEKQHLLIVEAISYYLSLRFFCWRGIFCYCCYCPHCISIVFRDMLD